MNYVLKAKVEAETKAEAESESEVKAAVGGPKIDRFRNTEG